MSRSPVSQKTHHCIIPPHVWHLGVLLWNRNLPISSVWEIFHLLLMRKMWQCWSARHRTDLYTTFQYRSFRKGDSLWGNVARNISVQSKAAWCDRNRNSVWAENPTSLVKWWGPGAWFVPPQAEFPRSFNFTFYFGPGHCSLSSNYRPYSYVLVRIHYYNFPVYRIHTNTQRKGTMLTTFLNSDFGVCGFPFSDLLCCLCISSKKWSRTQSSGVPEG